MRRARLAHNSISSYYHLPSVQNGTFLLVQIWERLQDPQAICVKAFKVVEEPQRRHPDVRALGITGQMHGIVYLNTRGECVSPFLF